ncbi:SLC13 family permease, partial [Paraglaciecola hydrolytica]
MNTQNSSTPQAQNPLGDAEQPSGKTPVQRISLIAGPLIALLMVLVPPPASLGYVGWATAAMGIWMAIWWATEAVPVAATALLPLALFAPLDILDIKSASAPYANPTIYLFLGGFILAAALQKSGLHRRIAYFILGYANTGAKSIIWGFMLVSAVLSMWMTNTSTTMMLLPIALSIISTLNKGEQTMSGQETKHFNLALLLGIAYAATIGGMVTLVGTPPNAFLAGFMNDTYGLQIGFAQWMLVGLPLAVVMLPLCFWVLTKVVFPVNFRTPQEAKKRLLEQQKQLGSASKAEKRVGSIFLLVALAWMTRPLLEDWFSLTGISDAGIAMLAAVAVFVVPAGGKQT